MPFGEKKDVDGKLIDFDAIYETLIREAVEGAVMQKVGGPTIRCIRCDKIAEGGWVHKKMISHIFDDDVAVVDLSTLNPNVFYELGVRHALRECVTVLLRRVGTRTPFNLAGFDCITYDARTPAGLAKARRTLSTYIANGLRGQVADSLVHEVLQKRRIATGPAERIDPAKAQVFKLRKAPRKRISVLTGDIRHVTGIDIWVNSENTNMQMARFFDRSGSAVIRYFGAKRDRAGQVIEDTIADELAVAMGAVPSVPPGTVLVTSAGELTNTNGVKRIFHAAAVHGQPGVGYRPVPEVETCISEALKTADSTDYASEKLRSIVFPILGAGTGGADLKDTVYRLVHTAINYFEHRSSCAVSNACFLAFTNRERDACLSVLAQAEVDRVAEPAR